MYENGVNGTFIGAYTGDTLPPLIVTTQPQLFLFFRSDLTTTMAGFTATYTISLCPNNCSGSGTCVNGVCVCNPAFKGSACETLVCPNSCSVVQGTCDTSSVNGCICNPSFKGKVLPSLSPCTAPLGAAPPRTDDHAEALGYTRPPPASWQATTAQFQARPRCG